MPSEQEDAGKLILDIYDTAIDPGHWPDILDRVARYIGARGAFIFELQPLDAAMSIQAPYFSTNYKPELVHDYLTRHHAQEAADQEVFARLSRQADHIELIGDTELAPSEEVLLARPNVQEMLRNGLRYRAGGLLNKDQINHDRFALQFAPWQGPFDADRATRAAQLLPHIAKALNVARPTTQLSMLNNSLLTALDQLVVGICVLDAKGSVVLKNREFERQLESANAFRITPSGRLIARSETAAGALAPLLESASHHGQYGARPRKEAVIVPTQSPDHFLCVEVVPLNKAEEFGARALGGHIIYSLDTANSYRISADVLKNLFALTSTETSILELMSEGMTNGQISDRRSTAVETVNSQVKSVLSKLGAANRTQAIRMATNMSASFVREA